MLGIFLPICLLFHRAMSSPSTAQGPARRKRDLLDEEESKIFCTVFVLLFMLGAKIGEHIVRLNVFMGQTRL
jgi:hypothetical protein